MRFPWMQMVSQQDGKPLMIEQSRESPRGLGVGLKKAQLLLEGVRSRGATLKQPPMGRR